MDTMKLEIKTIAPELKVYVDGVPQITFVYIQDITENSLRINDQIYEYEVQSGDTIQNVIDGIADLINNDISSVADSMNISEIGFELIGKESEPFEVLDITIENIREAVSTGLFDFYYEDAISEINSDTWSNQIHKGRLYYIAHKLTLYSKGNSYSGFTSQRVGDVSVSNGNPENLFLQTIYGVEFRKLYLKNRRINFTSCEEKFN